LSGYGLSAIAHKRAPQRCRNASGEETDMKQTFTSSQTADSFSNATFTFSGNADGDFVNATVGDISRTAIHFDNGGGDFVQANAGNISNDTITFGNGAIDRVETLVGNITNDMITFGNADGVGGDGVSAAGNITNDDARA
jgi:hypothetical protein